MHLTHDLPGTGGRLRTAPEDFRVWEIPAYEPSGAGPHRYFDLTKTSDTTPYAVERLARHLGIKANDIGYAGLKDRHAVTTQRLSIPAEVAVGEIEGLVEVGLHNNKLKRGHLYGNRFEIRVRGVVEDGLARAQAIQSRLEASGWPNFYGRQRFSTDNAALGRKLVAGERIRLPRWKHDLMIGALQSELYNTYLEERIREGNFARILDGDVCGKLPAGGMFVGTAAEEQPRLESWELSHTGPIYGSRMKWAEGPSGELEQRVLAAAGLTPDSFRAPGSRRRSRLPLEKFSVEADGSDLVFRFELPSGSYATVLLDEFVKDATGEAPEEEAQEEA